MTVGQFSQSALFGAFLGFCAAMLVHSLLILFGVAEPRYLKYILIGAGLIIWVCFRIIQERVALKDYQKLVEARRRRMKY